MKSQTWEVGTPVRELKPKCPKCAKSMERGHIPDNAHGQVVLSSWAAGEPRRQRFFGGIQYSRKNLLPMDAYRCTGCGYIELYAGD
jgi:ribosomal protein S27AE